MINEHDAIMVIFSEPQVRHCKTAHFLKTFGPAALPEGPELAAMSEMDIYNRNPEDAPKLTPHPSVLIINISLPAPLAGLPRGLHG